VTLLSKDQILQADDHHHEVVSVPEWGGEVRMRSLTGTERDAYEGGLTRQVGNKQVVDAKNARAKLVALSAVNEDGTPLFATADVLKLGSKNSAALQRLFDAACRLSGFSEEDMKEMEEGFGSAPNGASTSGSPSPSAAAPSPSSWQPSTPAN
jgi:hypothetical protein